MKPSFGRITYECQGRVQSLPLQLNVPATGPQLTVSLSLQSCEGGQRLVLQLNASTEVSLRAVEISLISQLLATDRLFLNGFQSWTDSREFRPDERMPGLPSFLKSFYAQYRLSSYGDYTFVPYTGKKGDLHGYTYTYVRNAQGILRFCGSLSEGLGYTIFRYSCSQDTLRVQKECEGLVVSGAVVLMDLFLAVGEEEKIFDRYFGLMNIPAPKAKPCTGWTSWYYHYTHISEPIILNNLQNFAAARIPIDVFQIDDGYQSAVGDWLSVNSKFPRGMKFLADSIRKEGFQPGLWLAPFICEAKSEIFRIHPDWVLKDKSGSFVVAGNSEGWSGDFYSMDFYNPEFREYLRKVFHTVLQEWGFEIVKLDFLYAVALIPQRGKSRGQVMTEAMDFLREVVGDKLILGCGVPLGPSFGRVDYCRIGCDIGLHWEERDPAIVHYRERVSTITGIANALGRRHLNGRAFLNDPDVFILRPENNELSSEQKHSLFLANLLCGSLVFTSDDIRKYSDNFFSAPMQTYRSQFPFLQPQIQKVSSFDEEYQWQHRSSVRQFLGRVLPYQNVYLVECSVKGRNYVAIFNLGDKAVSVKLPSGTYFDGMQQDIVAGTLSLPPFASRCLYRVGNESIEVLGGPGHVFSGCEVKECSVVGERISLSFDETHEFPTPVWMKVPSHAESVSINGETKLSYKETNGIKFVKFQG